MKFWLGVFTSLLVVAPATVIEYEVIVREVERQPREWVETPILDLFIDDWDELDRQSDCLFEYLRSYVGYEITMERVLTAGWWVDSLGGACYVIGEDDE